MLVLCKAHHDGIGAELLAPDPDDPRILRPVVPGENLARSQIAAKIQAAKGLSTKAAG